MKIMGIDTETTGLDVQNDLVVEFGYVLWDTDLAKPIHMVDHLVLADMDKAKLTEDIHGITRAEFEEFGYLPQPVFSNLEMFLGLHPVQFVVAHNGAGFDRPLMDAEYRRHSIPTRRLFEVPWLDTKTDLPWKKAPDSNRLKHCALELGFINPFPHRALFDVLTMLRVLSHFNIDEVIALSKIPFATIRALVSYEDRELAKKEKFLWEKAGDITYPKCWIKRIRINKLEEERAKCPFKIAQLE